MNQGPRKPKNLSMYSDRDAAVKGLRALANDLELQPKGTLIRWHINVSFWHPSWEEHHKAKKSSGVR
jgi:hypothetical protein